MSDPPASRSGTDPAVSVVIPTYNRARLLPRAVRSVLAQTYADFELIIVDDGSTDETRAAVAAFSDRRIHAMHEPHVGTSATRNRGIAVARGEWVAFLDDDNEWLPEHLERQLLVIDGTPDVGVVYCLTAVRMENSAVLSSRRYPESCPTGDVFDDFVAGWWAPLSGMVMRRATLVEAGGFCVELEAFDDLDVMMQMALRTTFGCSAEVLMVREERSEESPYFLDRLSRSVGLLDRRWRRRIVSEHSPREYLRWIGLRRRFVIRKELAWLYTRAHSERRVSAVSSLRRLARQLPWSALAVSRAVAVFVLSPRADERMRDGIRHLRRAVSGFPVPR